MNVAVVVFDLGIVASHNSRSPAQPAFDNGIVKQHVHFSAKRGLPAVAYTCIHFFYFLTAFCDHTVYIKNPIFSIEHSQVMMLPCSHINIVFYYHVFDSHPLEDFFIF